MPCLGLPCHVPTAPLIIRRSPAPVPCSPHAPAGTSSRKLRPHNSPTACSASTPPTPSPLSITDYDLYDLLGIDRFSDHSQVKAAYRSLQKRCHPDVAGPPGHDMAIVLNDAYAVLSNPRSRSDYDKELAKVAQVRGYTGKPIYSSWFGPESEQRALFVDEVKCVGCLKCALLASRTFAIESAYGRARVVAQWADPEHKVQDAIDACPVDCISTVERSDLAALEYLMSKQSRGNASVGIGNSGISNIFTEAKKFQTLFQDAMYKASTTQTKETEQRMSAIQAIRLISNLLYWKAMNTTSSSGRGLTKGQKKSSEPDMKKLREAAAARKQEGEQGWQQKQSCVEKVEYWFPSVPAAPTRAGSNLSSKGASKSSQSPWLKNVTDKHSKVGEMKPKKPLMQGVPVGVGVIAAMMVWSRAGEGSVGGLSEHAGGPLILGIVNSSFLQVLLAGITWCFVGAALMEIVEVVWCKEINH